MNKTPRNKWCCSWWR